MACSFTGLVLLSTGIWIKPYHGDVIAWIEQDDWPFRHMEGEDRARLREKMSELRLLLSEP